MAVLTSYSLGIWTVRYRVALGAAAVHAGGAAIKISSTSKTKGRSGAEWTLLRARAAAVAKGADRVVVIGAGRTGWREVTSHSFARIVFA